MATVMPGTKDYLEINSNVAEYVIAAGPSFRVVCCHFCYPLLISWAFCARLLRLLRSNEAYQMGRHDLGLEERP